MAQFLSINFFFWDFLNFCWVFQKFPFFLCHSVLETNFSAYLLFEVKFRFYYRYCINFRVVIPLCYVIR